MCGGTAGCLTPRIGAEDVTRLSFTLNPVGVVGTCVGLRSPSGSGLCLLSCVGLARATSRDGAEGGRRESAGGMEDSVTSFTSARSSMKCLSLPCPVLTGRAARSCRVWLFVRQAGRIQLPVSSVRTKITCTRLPW